MNPEIQATFFPRPGDCAMPASVTLAGLGTMDREAPPFDWSGPPAYYTAVREAILKDRGFTLASSAFNLVWSLIVRIGRISLESQQTVIEKPGEFWFTSYVVLTPTVRGKHRHLVSKVRGFFESPGKVEQPSESSSEEAHLKHCLTDGEWKMHIQGITWDFQTDEDVDELWKDENFWLTVFVKDSPYDLQFTGSKERMEETFESAYPEPGAVPMAEYVKEEKERLAEAVAKHNQAAEEHNRALANAAGEGQAPTMDED